MGTRPLADNIGRGIIGGRCSDSAAGTLLETMDRGHGGAWPSRGYGNEAFGGQHWTRDHWRALLRQRRWNIAGDDGPRPRRSVALQGLWERGLWRTTLDEGSLEGAAPTAPLEHCWRRWTAATTERGPPG